MNQNKKNFLITGLLAFAFIIFTILVMTVDVKEIGPKFSPVGFATINKAFFGFVGVNQVWYSITKWLGYLVLLLVAYFAIMGLMQLIQRKSLQKVDTSLYVLGGFYILVGFTYIIFALCVVNYRPIIMENGLEPSYPSSHTMLAICVLATAVLQFKDRIKNEKVFRIIKIVAIFLMIIIVLGRLLSGVHWFTDIVGSILISSTYVMLYYSVITAIKNGKQGV